MRTMRLKTVDAYIAFDFECPTSGGGTRLAPDVTERETQLLARAMTYKFALLGINNGGAKATVRATPDQRDDAMRRYIEEILPLVEKAIFLTATDLGTMPEDFRLLPGSERDELMHSIYSPPPSGGGQGGGARDANDLPGMPLDAFITGLGVAVAAQTVMSGLDGRSVAIEGFGKVGGATALEMTRRGARLVALSTIYGCVQDPAGFDVSRLLDLRARHGDRLVEHLGVTVAPASDLFNVEADVVVPGARVGVIDEARASVLRARVVAPAANVPYTARGLEVLRARGIVALADFVCNSGATVGYVADAIDTPAAAVAAVEERVRELTRASMEDPEGPFIGARRIAEAHLRTWLDKDQFPDGPALA